MTSYGFFFMYRGNGYGPFGSFKEALSKFEEKKTATHTSATFYFGKSVIKVKKGKPILSCKSKLIIMGHIDWEGKWEMDASMSELKKFEEELKKEVMV